MVSGGFLAFLAMSVSSLEIVSRNDWGARSPRTIEHMDKNVPYVIIHHSYTPKACYSSIDCKNAMRSMQNFHQDDRGWFDIGYTFAIGGDGKAYEGRGFGVVGAHAPLYNGRSIGICLIGDWQDVVPPENMLKTTQDLIAHAIDQGYLSSNYTLLGHRQVRDTICPGPALFNEIKQWPNFDEDIDFKNNKI